MKLVIVGSRELEGNGAAHRLIAEIIEAHMTDDRIEEFVVISGAPRASIKMAAGVARAKGVLVIEHLPRAQSWSAYRECKPEDCRGLRQAHSDCLAPQQDLRIGLDSRSGG